MSTWLSGYEKEKFFKLFLFDIGVLGHMLDFSFQKPLQQSQELGGTEQSGQKITWPLYYSGRLNTLSEIGRLNF